MNVLLVHPHTYFQDVSNKRLPDTLPIGVGIVQAILKEHGHKVDVLDVQGNDYSHDEVLSILNSYKDKAIDLVGISAMSTQYSYVKWIAKMMHQILGSDLKIVLGGCLAKFSYNVVLNNTAVDICFLADAERFLMPLINASDYRKANGIAYREDGKIQVNPTISEEPETCDITPDYDGVPVEKYIRVGDMWSTLTGRGCAFKCNFCSKQFDKLTFRHLESINEELKKYFKRYDFSYILVGDEYAVVNQKRAEEIGPVLSQYKPWYANGRVNTVTPKMLKFLRSTNCKILSYGIESGSQKILDNMNKKVTVEQIKNAIKWTSEADIKPNPQLIFGYPGENDETIAETMKLIDDLRYIWKHYHTELGFAFITPLPGSPLYDYCFQIGLLKPGPVEEEYLMSLEGGFNRPRFNFTEWTTEDLHKKHQECLARINSHLHE